MVVDEYGEGFPAAWCNSGSMVQLQQRRSTCVDTLF